ncbi:MAG TPA: hypothetical protein VK797_21770 [Tepidisphaeraceae bacterium]|jgi:hypothetical protein|nr:hypothetical protein [Tepidisphaeraceae bacterium]
MTRVAATCVALAVGALSVSAVQTPLPSDDALLQALSGPDWHQRREAIHQLIEIGPGGEARVRELLRRDLDREQRKNVEVAQQLIVDNRLFGASSITLHVSGAAAAEVMADISRQCSAPLPASPADLWKQDRWPKLTLDYDHKPFWDVMDELGRQMSFDYLSSESQEVRMTPGASRRDESMSQSGAFLFTASAYAARRGMSVDLSVFAEPKVVVLRLIDLKFDKATDDQGNPLLSQSGRGFGRRGFGGPWGRRIRTGPRQVSAPFQRPADDVTHIAELRGHVTLSVQAGTARWELSDPLGTSPVTRNIDGAPVTLDKLVSAGASGYELHVSISDSRNSAFQDEIADLLRRGLRIDDAAGRPLTIVAIDPRQMSLATDIEVDLSRDAKTGPPAKLIWDIPDQTRELLVPFSFKNIPIGDPFN